MKERNDIPRREHKVGVLYIRPGSRMATCAILLSAGAMGDKFGRPNGPESGRPWISC